MSKSSSSISKDVAFGFLPAQKKDRIFGRWDLTFVLLGIAVSCFALLIGGYTGMWLNAKESTAVILFGNSLPVLLIMPIAILFTRYGIDTFIGFRSALGYLGSNIFYFIFMVLTIGYLSIALYMSGQAVVKIASFTSLPLFFTSQETGAPFFAILIFILVFSATYRGPLFIGKFNKVGVPAILLVMVGIILALIFKEGLGNIFALSPAEPYEDWSRSFMTALEVNIGLGFSWLPYIGQYARLAKTEKGAFKAGFLSYGVLVVVVAGLGALSALLVASLDPTDWMYVIGGKIGGNVGSIILLLLLTVGNITAGIFLMYSQAISFKTVFPKKAWIVALATSIPTAFLLLSSAFYDAFDTFITVIAYIMAVFGGIVISDFFLVKKQNLSLRDLYDTKGAYKYWKGVNPSAIVAFVAGTITYWSLYNPITDTPSKLFEYTTAGIPSYFVALIVYYIAAKYIFSYQVDRKISETTISEKG